jgi:hypothetical protein
MSWGRDASATRPLGSHGRDTVSPLPDIIYNPSITLALSASCAVVVNTYAPRRQPPHEGP